METGLDRLRAIVFSRYPQLLPLEGDLDFQVSRAQPNTTVSLRDGDQIEMFLKHQTA
jgi:hypothetical protein